MKQLVLFRDSERIDQIKTQLEIALENGVPEWTNRQERTLDNILQGIVTRKKQPINTYDQLQVFVSAVHAKYRERYSWHTIYATAWHKFVNKQSSDACHLMFTEHPRVTDHDNKRDPNIDFWIDDIAIDLKVTVFPKRLPDKRFITALKDPLSLMEWYYKYQGFHRWNWQNRLFIVCHDSQAEQHIRLKADLDQMRQLIDSYLDSFDVSQLYEIRQENVMKEPRAENSNGQPVSDLAYANIIWNCR